MAPCRIIRGPAALLCMLLTSVVGDASALQLADVFSDHMVLQRRTPIRVWGEADPGARVEVSLGHDAPTSATAGEDGSWLLELPAHPAGGPHDLVVASGSDRINLEDVLVGEVWLASGQSNMQWSMASTLDAVNEIAAADWPQLRLLNIPRTTAVEPGAQIGSSWQVCTPETVPAFSAVAFFFGRRLHQQLGVPIGLINSSWGGTRIEPWTDAQHIDWLVSRLSGSAARAVRDAAQERNRLAPDLALAEEKYQASVEALKAAEAQASGARAAADLEDTEWPTMSIPTMWEEGGLPGFDGMVWFRKHLEIPAGWAGKDLRLHLGPADEADVTWFNGVQIGTMGSFSDGVIGHWATPRMYTIAGDLVKAGPAVLGVRIIDSAGAGGLWGGDAVDMYLTPADDSSERLSLAGLWKYQPGPSLEARAQSLQQLPSTLYNAMIHPLVPLSLQGAIWYQGEANVSEGAVYTEKMIALIDSWREAFGRGDLPFYFVQLAPFGYGRSEALPLLWEAQTQASKRRAHVGDVAINDVGDVDDIHPRDKRTVGERLANLALSRTYRQADIQDQGPRFARVTREAGTLRVLFDHARGLTTRDGAPPTWFEVADHDDVFMTADATIEGEFVVLRHPKMAAPDKVRFAWDETASPNLINGAGLPATPFRSALPRTK
ncbi:MAG: sialate O-acetylesterase [Gemmatimonadetes bacterium]|jgi:sialate O-acetylesterase|nr:sialate O-acetylesterase [Gemmatimonadota bacterium]MBT6144722.1 sialate O-acetylesterase [Gemmatimonadota bacterium]MBT7864240.1 sialate O-acetylesterase [Gemmatimonadota bacterium]